MSNTQLKEDIRRYVKRECRVYDDKISGLEKQILDLQRQVLDLRNALSESHAATKKIQKDAAKNNMQLALVEQRVLEQAIACVEESIKPELDGIKAELHEKTLDAPEMVTEYRRRVMEKSNTPLAITGNMSESQKKATHKKNFQRSMFVFTDED